MTYCPQTVDGSATTTEKQLSAYEIIALVDDEWNRINAQDLATHAKWGKTRPFPAWQRATDRAHRLPDPKKVSQVAQLFRGVAGTGL